MKNFYISDLHFFHKNIIRLTGRPYSSIEEMHEDFINRWNSEVTQNDTVYILGDVAFKFPDEILLFKILRQLRGHKILIKGNHEECLKYKLIRDCFEKIADYMEIEDEGKKVILFHYPMEDWNGKYKGSVHLFGHIHNNFSAIHGDIENRINVSCEVLGYTPRTLNDLLLKQKYGGVVKNEGSEIYN